MGFKVPHETYNWGLWLSCFKTKINTWSIRAPVSLRNSKTRLSHHLNKQKLNWQSLKRQINIKHLTTSFAYLVLVIWGVDSSLEVTIVCQKTNEGEDCCSEYHCRYCHELASQGCSFFVIKLVHMLAVMWRAFTLIFMSIIEMMSSLPCL